jgi:N-methylhydantoinase A
MSFRLGVDVGGTFTDLLLIDMESGGTFRAKVPSTPENQAVGILTGIEQVCGRAGITSDKIVDLMHGTTVATNAVLEGKGARVGLVTTEGYKQVLQIARSFVPGGLAGWIVWPKPEPLASLEDTFEVRGRISARGEEVRPLNEADLRIAFESLRARGVEAITISFINSFANPAHELRARAIAEEVCPQIPVSLSCDILPEMREYERTLTTVVNSYVRPTVSRYLARLEGEFASRSVHARLKVLRSDGGLMSFDAAGSAPINLLMSGPAGGVAGAVWVANQLGLKNLLTLDMGGTSTDVALIENGRPMVRRETTVGDINVRASGLDVRTVGAGGGSIAKVPELTGALRVGPESAGAVPGPAGYERGGTLPTVTDANLVLGYLPDVLLGGAMALNRNAAVKAVETIAKALGVSVYDAAAGIVNIVNENMLGAIRLVSVEQGFDPRNFSLVAFGGAGPLHANALGVLTGSWPVVIPPSPGVLCAYGDATTRVRNEAARTFIRRFDETSREEVLGIIDELSANAANLLADEGIPAALQAERIEVDVRYHGQGFEITLEVNRQAFERKGLESIRDDFEASHERQFTFRLTVQPEFVNIRAIIEGPPPKVAAETLAEGGESPAAAFVRKSPIYHDGEHMDASIYDRMKLAAGNVIHGPAIIFEMDSTTLILPGFVGHLHSSGSILISPQAN